MKAEDESEILRHVEEILARREKRDEVKQISTPMSKVDAIQKNRTPEGMGKIHFQGIPVDLFDIEQLILKVSPIDIRTLMRYEGSRLTEQILNHPRLSGEEGKKFNWMIIVYILIFVGIGIAVLVLLPRLSGIFGSLIPH